jgi:hypothetical protein
MPFDTANVETNVLICGKGKGNKNIDSILFTGNNFEFFSSIDTNSITFFPFTIFPFVIKPEYIKIIKHISKNADCTLGDITEIQRGFEFGINHTSVNKKKIGYRLIKGEHIRKYVVNKSEYYVRADFNNRKLFKTSEIFLRTPKLLSKFISNDLVFAFDNKGLCNTNVVYNIHMKTRTDNIYYLLGLLNSRLISFWFRHVYINDDKIFPHIQKNQLMSIPIALTNTKIKKNIINTVKKIISNKKKGLWTLDLESMLDAYVFCTYKVSRKKMIHILHSIDSMRSVDRKKILFYYDKIINWKIQNQYKKLLFK